jgi:hypothetical protein
MSRVIAARDRIEQRFGRGRCTLQLAFAIQARPADADTRYTLLRSAHWRLP